MNAPSNRDGEPAVRWHGLCDRLGLDGENKWAFLAGSYEEPFRAYHNLRHIWDCLRLLDLHQDVAVDPIALEAAIWFHDVIYDPRGKENEKLSAERAREFLNGTGLEDKVTGLIMATCHRAVATAADEALLADIDLGILGSPPTEYQAYAAAIRAEYSFVPSEDYRQGRTMILQGFLDRPSIYSTTRFRDLFEDTARANLAAEIGSLASSGGF
jgi:predicted metal-dependent HD superfamily phosphohydrolase